MNVLVACEFSGVVREAFRRRGHNAWSCDLRPSESAEGGHHLEGDVRHWLNTPVWPWDLIIAHPPCTYLCNSGVRWLTGGVGQNDARWEAMYDAATFFHTLLDADAGGICAENPIPHKYAVKWIGRKYDQIIQPWQFGHGETKATCLWLKNLPPLRPTNIVQGREARIHKMPSSRDQAKLRSITYQGVAEAMASQWGGTIDGRSGG